MGFSDSQGSVFSLKKELPSHTGIGMNKSLRTATLLPFGLGAGRQAEALWSQQTRGSFRPPLNMKPEFRENTKKPFKVIIKSKYCSFCTNRLCFLYKHLLDGLYFFVLTLLIKGFACWSIQVPFIRTASNKLILSPGPASICLQALQLCGCYFLHKYPLCSNKEETMRKIRH